MGPKLLTLSINYRYYKSFWCSYDTVLVQFYREYTIWEAFTNDKFF